MPLQTWFYTNIMALNPDKSSAVLLGTARRASSYSSLASVDVAGTPVQLVRNIKLLGITFDTKMTYNVSSGTLNLQHNAITILQCGSIPSVSLSHDFTISVRFVTYMLS